MPGRGTPPGEALYPECQLPGSAGPRRHRREGTPTCAHCRAETTREMARYRKELAARGPVLVPVLGTTRRLQALARVGWGQADLAAAMGMTSRALSKITRQQMVRRDVAEQVAALYRELAFMPGRNRLARAQAEARGWPGPLDWHDDLDDGPDVVAWIVVERAHAEALLMHREFKKMLAKRERRAQMTEEERAADREATRLRKRRRPSGVAA